MGGPLVPDLTPEGHIIRIVHEELDGLFRESQRRLH